ncbi:MAG: putative lipid II flippase FtsW [Bacteriovoracaceae bacterium]
MEQDKITGYFKINVGILMLFGFIMVYSASYIYAKEVIGSSGHFFIKQIVYAVAGIALAFTISKSKFTFWYKYGYQINIAFLFLLLLTFVPHIGVTIKGSHRWLNLGGFNLQPGELVKYSVLLCALKYFEDFEKYTTEQKILYSFSMFAPLGVLLLQPDFGTFAICLSVMTFVAFMSRFPRKYFYSFLITAFMGALFMLGAAPYRVKRILAFLDPWKDPKGSGFQIIQSYLAFANGSIFGQGIGNSNEKLFYLPESYNDFIFSVVGEELGFAGVCFVVCLFLSFIYLGLKMAINAKERKVSIFISAVIFVIGFQAFLNMGVVLGLLPTKGLNLPFISYGGSSLLSNFVALGLVFSALKFVDKEKAPVKSGTKAKAQVATNEDDDEDED